MQTAGPQREPKQRVTVLLADEAGGEGHRFGVNALASTSNAVWADGPQLITAGRDGTVRCWHLGAPQPTQTYCIDEHDDWVNDLALVPDVRCPLRPNPRPAPQAHAVRPPSRAHSALHVRAAQCGQTLALVTASSDHTVKLWKFAPRRTGDAVAAPRCHTLRRHTDFVKALAYAPAARLLGSAGCDGAVVLWDLQSLTPIGGSADEPVIRLPHRSPAAADNDRARAYRQPHRHSDSIYALSTNADGSLFASGSVDRDVRLWDPRAPKAGIVLRGHTDVVRSAR